MSQEMISEAYERGLRDGYERSARLLADPVAAWSNAWRPAIYRACIGLLSRAYPDRPMNGEMSEGFGRHPYRLEDFLWRDNQ